MEYILVDSYEQIKDNLKDGDFVKCLIKENYGEKAQIVGFDPLSEIGCYRDRWTIEICKTKEKIDCVRECFERWVEN